MHHEQIPGQEYALLPTIYSMRAGMSLSIPLTNFLSSEVGKVAQPNDNVTNLTALTAFVQYLPHLCKL